jgi:hypothetical protein
VTQGVSTEYLERIAGKRNDGEKERRRVAATAI